MKASMVDLLFIMVIAVSVIFVAMFMYKIFDKMIVTTSSSNSTNLNEYGYFSQAKETFKFFDSLVILLTFGLGLSVIALAFIIPSHPIFLFVAGFLLMVMIILAAQFSNIYKAVIDSSAISPIVYKFPMSGTIFSKLPNVVLLISAVILIGSYVRRPGRRRIKMRL